MTELDPQQAVAALLALNGDDKPYQLDATQGPDGPVVSARWKVWDVRWKTLISGGTDQVDYQLDVRLQPPAGTYTFLEGIAREQSSVQVTPLDVSAHKSWSAFKGKTAGYQSREFVIGGKVRATDGTGTQTQGRSWSGTFRPADLKTPVVETLRGLGWRPPHDSWWARLWEK